ncbi:glyoxalase [Parafrankia sp. BMG5.11]|nr:glyoxalase [Parafrankia sp. BMG5.11]
MPADGDDAARRFYGEVLGLVERPKPTDLAARGGCWFHTPGVELHLGVDEAFVPARKAHPALLVEDLAATCAHLAAAGVNFVEGSPLEGYVRGDICDPFGNRIELMQRLGRPGGVLGGR